MDMVSNLSVELVSDPGLPAKPVIAGRFLRSEIRAGLKRLSRAYGPAAVHLAKGPGNSDLLSAIRGLI